MHLDKAEHALDDLARLGAQQEQHGGQQVGDGVHESGGELVEQPGQSYHGSADLRNERSQG